MFAFGWKNIVIKEFNFDDFAICDNNLAFASLKTDADIVAESKQSTTADSSDEEQIIQEAETPNRPTKKQATEALYFRCDSTDTNYALEFLNAVENKFNSTSMKQTTITTFFLKD